MKRILVVVLSAAVLSPLAAEPPYRDEERALTTTVAMTVLGSWSVGNIALSTPLYFLSQGQSRYLHEMNVAWNLVNLGIAASALIRGRSITPSATIAEAIAAQRGIESALLLNTGLDVAYITAGWALMERSRRNLPDADRWAGYGSSLIIQGGFLLVFDVAFYAFQRRNRPDVVTVQ